MRHHPTPEDGPDRESGDSPDGITEQVHTGDGAPRQVDELFDLAVSAAHLFHDRFERAYAAPRDGGHPQLVRLDGADGRRWLQRLYRDVHGRVPNAQAVAAAKDALIGEALLGGPEEPVHVRLAETAGAVYLDLGDETGRAVRVAPSGWDVVADAPVHFRRSRATAPLPAPVKGGQLSDLRRHVNAASHEDFVLLLGWAVSTLMSAGPYPVLILQGEHGRRSRRPPGCSRRWLALRGRSSGRCPATSATWRSRRPTRTSWPTTTWRGCRPGCPTPCAGSRPGAA